MSSQIFNAVLTALYAPSDAIALSAQRLTLDFELTVATAAATVNWYLEFTDGNPNSANTKWYREIAEEDAGSGVVLTPEVVRTFADNAGTTLAIGTHRLSAPFVRQHMFARVQIKESGGAASVTAVINSLFGATGKSLVSGP